MYEKHIKRPLDFALALLVLILFWPILLIIAIAVRVNMGSPIVFTQQRPGLGGEVFKIKKFRTMTDARDANGKLLPDDQRLTKFGSLMRASSGDEVLELISIVKGDLALVGPRPLLVEYLDKYSEEQMHRHDVRPGLTGYAQTEGRNLCSWEDKFKKDMEYVNNITFLGDWGILLKTVAVVLKREGINSKGSATMEAFTGNGK
ncbi:sugar transferase [Clostridiaceae bacterium]|nr:sugar transferase [Clostridiaceae bacterium]RKI09973.1 sugar transferase [bacterium 1XD21-70]